MEPNYDIAMVPPQVGKCPNARSKLDDLLSRILDINAIMRKLSEMIQEPTLGVVNRVVTAVKLVRYPFVICRAAHGFAFSETHDLGHFNWN